jgi:hypothetical protein
VPDVAILFEIVTLANSQSEVSAHPRKVLFDAYHTKFQEHGRDTAQDKACLRVLLLLAGPHAPGNTLMERFQGIIQQAGFELEYDNGDTRNDNTHNNRLPDGVGEQTMAESEAIVRALQQQHTAWTKQQPAVAELEETTQDPSNHLRNSRSVPNFERGSQQTGGTHGNLAAMPYTSDRPDPYAMPRTNIIGATQTGSVTDNQTEDVMFPGPDQPDLQQGVRRMNALEELAVSKDSHQLKADSFRIWRQSTREKKATDFHRRKLLARVTSQFASRQHDDYKAEALHREILGKRSKEALQSWRAEVRLYPAEQQFSTRHDYRLTQQCMGSLRTLVRLPGHAEAVREKALKRKGFDTWGEELRVLAIKEKIDYRLLMSTVYQWLQKMREQVFRRQLDQRLKHRAIHTLLNHYRAQQDRLRAAEASVAAKKRARQIIGAFVTLSSKLDQLRRHEEMADQFYHPKIEFENLLLWQGKLGHVQRMGLRADDAREYFLSVKFLKLWRTRTKERKEQRLNQAYKQIRRRGKIRIVRAALDTWRSQSSRLQTLGGIGQDFARQHDHRLLRKHFVRWRNRTSQLAELEHQATAHFTTRQLSHCFPSLVASAHACKLLDQRADDFLAINTADVAGKLLRKLNTKAFQLRRRQQDADAMAERHQRSHYRSMLRLWARKAGGSGRDHLGDGGEMDNPDEEADRIMDESLLPDIEDDETAAPGELKKRTPVPEYLHTPSNRAARVRRLGMGVGVSTTPATAPPGGSFAARLLAGGISLTPRRPRGGRGGLGGGGSRLNESMMG